MKKKLFIIIAAAIIITGTTNAQNTFPASGATGIGTASPNASSLLDVTSTTKGMLVPRMTKAQRDLIAAPATGLLIYQTNSTPGFYYYSGTAWTALKPANAAKKLNNLTSPTAINVELLPDTNNTVDLGSSSQAWKNIYASGSYFTGSNKVIDVSGSENTFIGNTGNTTNTGSSNTATGKYALQNNTTGYYNTATGAYALGSNTTGYQNTATGRMALAGNTTGYWNTATGMVALLANTTGNKNTAIGQSALQSNTTASENTAVGASALASQSYNPGSAWISANTAVGYEALYANQPTSNGNGYSNTAIGHSALRNNTTAVNNTATGMQALYNNTTGYENTAIGMRSLYSNTIGYANTAIGVSSLSLNTSGNFNTVMGHSALHDNTTGNSNIAIGVNSLYKNTTGFENTSIGDVSLYFNTTGAVNTAIGFDALTNNTIGNGNVATGHLALYNNTTGFNSTAVGRQALYYNTGSNNTAVGTYAGNNNATSPSNFTALGYNAGHVGTNTNTIEIGNTSVTWISGQVPWSLHSDRRIKDNIQSNVPGLSFITKLNPVTYNLNIHRQNEICGINDTNEWEGKYDIEKMVQTGFIAQEVEQAAKECNYDFNGVRAPWGNSKLYSVSYASFVMPLVKAVQELSEELTQIKSILTSEQQQKLNELKTEKSNSLEQNFPNPFNTQTEIKFQLPEKYSTAQIMISDLSGKQMQVYDVKNLFSVFADANQLASGTYEYALIVDGKIINKKQMMVSK